jgi:RhtB (resistance to homoserine/threonine) family protein
MPITEFFSITFIIILAAISPGPDFALVVKNALSYGRKSGVFTALGVSCSLIIHSAYCLLGLAIVISKSLLLFSIIKFIGAAYLIYIGVKSLLANKKSTEIHNNSNKGQISSVSAFIQGLLCNLLNPKSIMFVLAFFTLIINPTISELMQINLGIEISVIHFLWFSFLAFIITHQHVKRRLSRFQYYITKTMGVVLIGFGARIAFLSKALT